MKHQKNYNIFDKEKIVAFIALIVIIAVIAFWIGTTAAEEPLATCWIMCDPRQGSTVSVRRKPTKDSMELGRLECGDGFRTDGETIDGWVRCYGIGENGEGWIYSGYVATEKPEMIMGQYCCVAKNRVAVRRWMGGPQIIRNGKKLWLNNCEDVTVFCMADGWACTNIGYIKAEWLEADPE